MSIVGDGGAAALSKNLSLDTKRSRTLYDNMVDNDGATVLAEVLKTNATLFELDPQDIRFGNDGATALADAFKTNTPLINLDLEDNDINSVEAMGLAEALKTNKTLIMLNLMLNRSGNEELLLLSRRLRETPWSLSCISDSAFLIILVDYFSQRDDAS